MAVALGATGKPRGFEPHSCQPFFALFNSAKCSSKCPLSNPLAGAPRNEVDCLHFVGFVQNTMKIGSNAGDFVQSKLKLVITKNFPPPKLE